MEQNCEQWNEYGNTATLVCLAKVARMELLKEKLKQRIEAEEGKKLDRIAEALVKGMKEYKEMQADFGNRSEELKDRFEALFED